MNLDQRRSRADQSGMTLIELLVSIVLLTLITGTLATVLATGLSNDRPARQRARENNDAQVIAAYLVRDAQAAGGSSPQTGRLNTALGVSTSDAAGCTTGSGTLVVRFKWRDWTGAATFDDNVANYFFNAADNSLARVTCIDGGAPVSLQLASSISASPAPSASCANSDGTASACEPNLPDIVTLGVSALNNPVNSYDPITRQPTPYNYVLTAAVRPQAQTAPSAATATYIPLLALGSACGGGVTGIEAQGGGASTITVYGGAAVNGGCPAVDFQGSIDFNATGGIGVLAPGTCAGVDAPGCGTYSQPIGDPFATLAPPTADCANGTHPAPSGNTYFPGTYKTLLTVGNATFMPGIYIFCAGVTTTGTVTANGVLFYITGGTITVTGNFSASAMHSGMYGDGTDNNDIAADIVVWQAKTDSTSPQICCSNNTVASFDGTFYAPNAIVTLHNGTLAFKALIALGVSWQGGGNGGTTFGTPVNTPTITTALLPNWTVNRPYSATVQASGGSGGYSWSATGLPTGLSINPSTGVISGTPTATGSYSATVTVQDSIGQTNSKSFSININPAPTIATSSLPNWTINRNYPNTAVTTTPGTGTAPFTWSATGLPSGLSINATTGVISGTPTATGTSNPTVTVTDIAGATGTRSFTVDINAAPSITAPATLPDWTISSAYPATTVTAANGTAPPYTWAASGLPTGMSINASSGVIAGTPSVSGNFSVTVTVTDAAGATGTRNYTFKINSPPTVGAPTLNVWTVNRPYSDSVTPSGGTPRTPTRRRGFRPDSRSTRPPGAITGTPTAISRVLGEDNDQGLNELFDVDDVHVDHQRGAVRLRPVVAAELDRQPYVPQHDDDGHAGHTVQRPELPLVGERPARGHDREHEHGRHQRRAHRRRHVHCHRHADGRSRRDRDLVYTLVVNNAPSITTSSLTVGERTVAYNASMAATSGTPAYTWAASGLPAGMSISAAARLPERPPRPARSACNSP